MAGASVKIEVDDKQLNAGLNALAARAGDLSEAFRDIGAFLERSHDERFKKGISPSGLQWKELSPTTRARKKKNKDKILQETGTLRDSLHYFISANMLEFGTNDIRGATHQFGAEMGSFGRYYQLFRRDKYSPVDFRRSSGSKIGHPIPWGDIPARPFLGLSNEDISKIDQIIRDHLASFD